MDILKKLIGGIFFVPGLLFFTIGLLIRFGLEETVYILGKVKQSMDDL